jgi:hypothetical protein
MEARNPNLYNANHGFPLGVISLDGDTKFTGVQLEERMNGRGRVDSSHEDS